jgi:hypothetical protein
MIKIFNRHTNEVFADDFSTHAEAEKWLANYYGRVNMPVPPDYYIAERVVAGGVYCRCGDERVSVCPAHGRK